MDPKKNDMGTFLRLLVVGVLATCAVVAQADVRVEVVYGGDETFVGIAKAGRMVEILKGGRYAPSDDKSAKGAGIRLWYWRDFNGFVFLDYARVRSVKVLGTLTSEETAELEKAMAKPVVRKARVTSSEPQPASRPATESRPAAIEPDPVDAPILKEFPPEEGWNLERPAEIQRRRIVLHIGPTTKELDFLAKFEAFKEAFEKAKAAKPSNR